MLRDGLIRTVGKDVVVVGGGVSGITVSLELKRLGMDVTLVEKEESLGGVLKSLSSVLYGGEVVDTQSFLKEKLDALSNSGIKVIASVSVTEMEGFVGEFTLRLSNGEKLEASQVVVATGLEYGASPGDRVIDQLSMESLIKTGIPSGSRVCFYMDSNDWGFKVSSVNAFKQAMVLVEKFGAKVYLVARDFKVSFDGGEEIFRSLREKGVTFFKVSKFLPYRELGDGVSLELVDELFLGPEKRISLDVDYLVVPTPSVRAGGSGQLLRYLRVEDGNLYREENPQLFLYWPSFKKGIYFAGSCTYPMLLDEVALDADDTALRVFSINKNLEEELDTPYAKVNPEKCALCLTCLRNCPTGSITFKVYEGKKNVYFVPYVDDGRSFEAAYIDVTSCFGCGICASECPAKAIELVGLEDDVVVKSLEV